MNNNSTNHKDTNHKATENTGMNKGDKRFWTIVGTLIILAILVVLGMHHPVNAPSEGDMQSEMASSSMSTSTDMSESASSTQVYNYSCDNDKSITTTFHLPKDDFVNVNLSDGRRLILAHVISADGARYANANQSIIFWTKGVTAFVTENGTSTYSGCVANRFP